MLQSFLLVAFSCFASLNSLWCFDRLFQGDRKRSKMLWFFFLHICCTAHDYIYVDQDYDITRHLQADMADGNYEGSLHYLYLVSIGVWLSQLLETTVYAKTSDVDVVVMCSHHVITLALLLVSFACKQKAFGALILFQHDVSDIFVSFTKMMVKLRPDSPIVPIAYVYMLATWAYWRLYRFSYVLVGITLLPTFFELPMVWQSCVVMLSCLAGLHHYWFILMVRIAFKTDKVKAYESK
jgi:hypothetical protein